MIASGRTLARWYAPELGRFVTADPLIGQDPTLMAGRVLESGLYGYAAGNPIMGKDPSGLTCGEDESCVGDDGTEVLESVAPTPNSGTAALEGFLRLTEGPAQSLKDMPTSVRLPEPLVSGLDAAWNASLPGGRSQEQGGILVRNADKTHEWKRGSAGSSGTFIRNYGDREADETLVLSAHTHPYDKSEGGHVDVSFSRKDLSNVVNDDERMKVVQSGATQFAVVKTREFEQRVAGLDAAGKAKLQGEMEAYYAKVLGASAGTFSERVEAAAKATATTYNLGYYRGSKGALSRQN